VKILEHRFGYGVALFALLLCGYGVYGSLQFQAVSQWFPLFVSAAGVLVAVLILVFDTIADRRGTGSDTDDDPVPTGVEDVFDEHETGTLRLPEEDEQRPSAILRGFAVYLLWFAAFALLFFLLGMPLAVFVWLLAFVRFAAHDSWLRAVISGVAMAVLLTLFAAFLPIALPVGLLIDSSAIVPTWRL
jgi:hypothetical protein